MKEIFFSKNDNSFVFDFHFKHSTHVLMSILGGVMVFVFTVFYLIKPYFTINDDNYFLLVFFVASLASLHMYGRYKWLSVRKKLVINQKEIMLYYAGILQNKIRLDEVKEIKFGMVTVFIFPINAINIVGKDGKISILGFKRGEDMDDTHDRLKRIIQQKSQV